MGALGGGGVAELVQIFISFTSSEIWSLQFQYLKNGKHVLSEKHGGDFATSYHAVSIYIYIYIVVYL